MWLEASRLARGDCAELENPFPPPTPGAHSLQRQQKCFLSIPSLILGKRGQARLYICLGAGAGAILTRIPCTNNMHRTAPEPPDVKNTHLGLDLGAGGWAMS